MFGPCPGLLFLFLFLKMRKTQPAMIAPITARPPTTPPAIAPTGVDFFSLIGAGVPLPDTPGTADETVLDPAATLLIKVKPPLVPREDAEMKAAPPVAEAPEVVLVS
jgi:hypothetical protein